ncbi:MAG: LamG domain-containing protein [Bacteroidetes bacterium]|nr:MAG: LamG domain-containing protein [Bacteroidota bacterium]
MKKITMLTLLILTMDCVSATPLNGNYTINPLLPASATNFLSFSSAITYLTTTDPRNDGGPANTGTVGVSGPVTFTVSAGVYQSYITVPAIPGVSPTNRVTFEGVNAASTIIEVGATNQATILILNVNYVTFRNFTINNNASGVTAGVFIMGSTANNSGTGCRISNCIINMPNATASGGSAHGSGGLPSHAIVVASFFSTSLDAMRADSVLIDSNTINGAYNGISIQGQFDVGYNRYMRVIGNKINAYSSGIQMRKVYTNLLIQNNSVNMYSSTMNTTGIRLNDCDNNTAIPSVISANRVTGATEYGMYVGKTTSDPLNPTLIYNNLISSPAMYGMYIAEFTPTWSDYHTVKCYHNSINLTGPCPFNTQIPLYYYGYDMISEFKNNIFRIAPSSVATTTYAAVFSGLHDTTSVTVNRNIYHNSIGSTLIRRSVKTGPFPWSSALLDFTAADFKQKKAGGVDSWNGDPSFASEQNLYPTNGCWQGENLTAIIPFDIENNTRMNPPSVGAFEPLNDISVDKVYLSTPYVFGPQELKVRVKSNSRNTINSYTVNYRLNNGTQVSLSLNNPLNCGDTALVFFTGVNQPNLVEGMNNLVVYTSSPNTVTDYYKVNDTTKLVIQTITKQNGGAIQMAGTGYATFLSKPTMIGDSAISICTWVKLSSNNVMQKIASKSNSTNGFALGVDNLGRLDAEVWTVSGGNTPLRLLTSGTSFVNNYVPVNEWTHVAFTWKSGVGVKIYINGMLAGEMLSPTLTLLKQSTTNLHVGANSWTLSQRFNGRIDELSIWNKELSAYQMKNYMHRTLKGNETGLVSYMQFNEPFTFGYYHDLISLSTANKGNNVNHLQSTAPLGGDSSLVLLNQTSVNAVNANLNISFTDSFDNAVDVGITQIPYSPNVLPVALNVLQGKYWVIRPYGNTGVFQTTLQVTLPAGAFVANDLFLGLYKRGYNSDSSWTLYKTASSVTATGATFQGIDTFGQFMIASNGGSPLFVNLVDYGAKWVGNDAQVYWKTTGEMNLSGYSVERSYDGVNFAPLSFVKTTDKRGAITRNYTYNDTQLDKDYATFYYRVKSVDINNVENSSPIIVLNSSAIPNQMTVYPNPFNSFITINNEQELEGTVMVKLINSTGLTVYQNKLHLIAPVSTITIEELGNLPEGIYCIQISNKSNLLLSTKVMKSE